MELTGKIILVLTPLCGGSKQGNAWHKQEYVLETISSYPDKVKFDLFGDLVDKYQMLVGDTVTLDISIESREYNGR